MTIIDEMAEFIGRYEGCANCKKDGLIHPYICPAGYPTQGYGIRVKDLTVPAITQDEALKRFKNVIPTYISYALLHSPILAKYPTRLIAITSFIFNLGPAAYASSTLKKKINHEDWSGASREILKWNHGGGRVLKGLTKRRVAESILISQERA